MVWGVDDVKSAGDVRISSIWSINDDNRWLVNSPVDSAVSDSIILSEGRLMGKGFRGQKAIFIEGWRRWRRRWVVGVCPLLLLSVEGIERTKM